MKSMDFKQWLTESSHRAVTDQLIADLLGVTRKTANKRINDRLTADDLLAICGKLGVNRTLALVEFGHLPFQDVLDFLDSDGQLIATADDGLLALELARRLNPATLSPVIDELAARREGAPVSDAGDVMLGYAADRRVPEPEEGDEDYGDGA